ncbi:AcrR family transcriptional regulator [Catenuloplanes nepalensis]|uniref:AcrR family transcriptional regulator n=1 Tax=Catenuloplanes nepalensis TaxID=587533 RepID=A0ABT9MUB2_9ACTN|nr:TetR/AcrR family transcriptional regulator [Catenuloplanes nepalensis]MDP9795038.1 AcrR family transcriptional regulator [Catenuloplanes nepalensis]
MRDGGAKPSRNDQNHTPARVRRDAAANRRRILTAARRLFGPGGDAVQVRDVARSAGVSAATLYRHFPARRELMDAVIAEQSRSCDASVRRAVSDPDPARALRAYVEHAFEAQADGAMFAGAIRAANATLPGHADRVARFRRDLALLVGRARAAGVIRPDVTAADVLLVIAAGGGASLGLGAGTDAGFGTPGHRAARSRRLADIVLTGMGLRFYA